MGGGGLTAREYEQSGNHVTCSKNVLFDEISFGKPWPRFPTRTLQKAEKIVRNHMAPPD